MILPLFIGILVFVLGTQIYRLYSQWTELEHRLLKVSKEADALETENDKLTSDLEYFGDVRNLVKELKTLFNYKNPGEKLIIVIPKKETQEPQP